MKRFLVFALFASVGLATGCGAGNITGSGDGGFADGSVRDGPLNLDALLGCADPGGAPCRATETCFQDRCVTNACVAQGGDAGAACPAGDVCTMQCVPVKSKCEGVTCSANQTCVNGTCVPGCFAPDPCVGKT